LIERESLPDSGVVVKAVTVGEASPTDLAYLTDRVLLASGKLQTYGTQITARDGRFVACRLRNPETVDDRRASVGLGSLETYLRSALELYGSPSPAHMPCPSCNAEIEVWLARNGWTINGQVFLMPRGNDHTRPHAGHPFAYGASE
jgi:hypothetical protein